MREKKGKRREKKGSSYRNGVRGVDIPECICELSRESSAGLYSRFCASLVQAVQLRPCMSAYIPAYEQGFM